MRTSLVGSLVLALASLTACSGNPDAQVGAMEGEQNAAPTLPAPSDPQGGGLGGGSATPAPKGGDDDDDGDAGAPAKDAGSGDAGGGAKDAGAAPGAFGAACSKDKDCASNVCFDFPARGKRCTKACSKDSECAAVSPNLGCSVQQKVCRVL
ncbi:MAG: hypothetical protein JNL38_37345 [Myxococcales bacterium]|jgi:hypothetical protein|nr:hypothetical protein [Myxococcales bacterium]